MKGEGSWPYAVLQDTMWLLEHRCLHAEAGEIALEVVEEESEGASTEKPSDLETLKGGRSVLYSSGEASSHPRRANARLKASAGLKSLQEQGLPGSGQGDPIEVNLDSGTDQGSVGGRVELPIVEAATGEGGSPVATVGVGGGAGPVVIFYAGHAVEGKGKGLVAPPAKDKDKGLLLHSAGKRRVVSEGGFEGASKKPKVGSKLIIWEADFEDRLFGAAEAGGKTIEGMVEKLPLPGDCDVVVGTSVPEAAVSASVCLAQGMSYLFHITRQAGNAVSLAGNDSMRVEELESQLATALARSAEAERRAAQSEEARLEALRGQSVIKSAWDLSRGTVKHLEDSLVGLSETVETSRKKFEVDQAAREHEVQVLKSELETSSARAVELFRGSAECQKMIDDASVGQFIAGFDQAVARGRELGLDMSGVVMTSDDPVAEDTGKEEAGPSGSQL